MAERGDVAKSLFWYFDENIGFTYLNIVHTPNLRIGLPFSMGKSELGCVTSYTKAIGDKGSPTRTGALPGYS